VAEAYFPRTLLHVYCAKGFIRTLNLPVSSHAFAQAFLKAWSEAGRNIQVMLRAHYDKNERV
jgi:hypothetical protein